jgi:hypothetical protein
MKLNKERYLQELKSVLEFYLKPSRVVVTLSNADFSAFVEIYYGERTPFIAEYLLKAHSG